MASCSLGISNFKISSLEFGRSKVCFLRPCGLRTSTEQMSLQYASLVTSKCSSLICCGPSLDTQSSTRFRASSEEIKTSSLASQITPSSHEVEMLLTTICDTTSIAEFDLKLAGFQLHVLRDLTGKQRHSSPPSPTFVNVNTTAESPDLNNSASTTSLVISKPVPLSASSSSSEGIQALLDRAQDEGLVILQSPRVGFFQRSRTIKGKRAPPSCKEKQIVKEGQVVCYIEQLGGELPIESDVCGEVVKILRKDGDPVGYGDPLIAILPSFPGIKKLQ